MAISVVDGDTHWEVFVDNRVEANDEFVFGVHSKYERHVNAGDVACDWVVLISCSNRVAKADLCTVFIRRAILR